MDDRPPEHRSRSTREERVRSLGFDPAFLTPREQAELLEWYSASPAGGPAPPGAQLAPRPA